MSSLQDRLDSLVGLEARAAEINRQVGSAQSEILAAIRAGESNGDKIKDFLRVIGDWSFQQGQPLRDLDARLEGKSGEPVLALEITHNHDHQSDDHIELGSRNRTYLAFYLGKINGELSFDLRERVYSIEEGRIREPRLIIPAKQYLQSKIEVHDFNLGDPNTEFYPHSELRWKSVSSPLCLDLRGILPPNQFLGLPASSERLSTRIYVGKEVEEYFTAAKTNRFLNRQALVYSYSNGAKELGLELSPAVKEEVGLVIDAEKKSIVEELVKTYSPDATRNDRLNKNTFERALQLGMHLEPREIRYGCGLTLNIPTYILESCTKQGITLPES